MSPRKQVLPNQLEEESLQPSLSLKIQNLKLTRPARAEHKSDDRLVRETRVTTFRLCIRILLCISMHKALIERVKQSIYCI